MMTKKQIEVAVEEARVYGDSFVGNLSFDVLKDSKKIQRYLNKNSIEDVAL